MTELVWIKHTPGDCPVPPETMVRVRFLSNIQPRLPRAAEEFFWGEAGPGTITHYTVVLDPKLDLSDFRERVSSRLELLKADKGSDDTITDRRNAFWRECFVALACAQISMPSAEAADLMLSEAIKRGRV